jgi:dethiobiotin synthetase
MAGFFITGTDTGVGKTMITAMLAAMFKKRYGAVGVYKPVESGGRIEQGKPVSLDMEFVKEKARLDQDLAEMNTYCFSEPVSPHLAARLNKQEIEIDKILAHFCKLQEKYPWILVEGAGGICVPLTESGVLMADLIGQLGLPVIVVTRPNLGTINHTLLTVKYAQSQGLTVAGIIINYTHDIYRTVVEETNPDYLHRLTGIPLLGVVPYQGDARELNPEDYLII